MDVNFDETGDGLDVLFDDVQGLSDETKAAVKEQTKILQGLMDRKYASQKDLDEFVAMGTEMKATNDAIRGQIEKYADLPAQVSALSARFGDGDDSIESIVKAVVTAHGA